MCLGRILVRLADLHFFIQTQKRSFFPDQAITRDLLFGDLIDHGQSLKLGCGLNLFVFLRGPPALTQVLVIFEYRISLALREIHMFYSYKNERNNYFNSIKIRGVSTHTYILSYKNWKGF